ncbi:MAG: hypothetical protein J0M26_27950, partial [Planctomycetes bacterium]|nr:hypothetical protein [Planctomycetota bacterium]
ETTTATARELYLSTLMTISETAAEATMRADRDKEIALADSDLQKQLTGNESAHTTAVNNANSAHSTATANAEAARKSAEQAALTQLNSTLAQATKDKEASIAGAERTYDQAVASLDAQYGSESSNGDTGVEGATRRSAIKTRDAQYYAARDTSWANTLSSSTTLGTSPWTVKAISAANGQAAYSTSRANAQAAHDAAMLDAIEDWQLSSRESLTDLLFTEGQSRETYNIATSNVYANWENGVGNLLGDKPEGTGWGMPVGKFAGSGNEGNNQKTGNREFAQYIVGDETGQPEGTANGDSESQRPQLPNRDNIVPRLEFDFFWIGGYRPTRESIKKQDTWIREGIPDSVEAQRSLVVYAFFTNLIGLSQYRQMCLCQAAVQDHLGRSREILHDEGVESLLEEQKRAAAGIVDNSMFKQFYEIEYIQSQLPNTTLFAVPNVDSIRDQFNHEISSRRGTTGYSNGADAAPFVDTVIIEVATLPLQFVPFGKVMPASAARGPILSGFDMPVRPQTRSADFINPKQLLDNADDVPLQKVVNDAPKGTGVVDDAIRSADRDFAPGSLSAAKSWTRSGRLRAYQRDYNLPIRKGYARYIPPDSWSPNQALPRGQNGGFIDKFGNEWVQGVSRTPGQLWEWDVQLGRNASIYFRDKARGGTHVNVSWDGEITH